jgi:hypothetical protein
VFRLGNHSLQILPWPTSGTQTKIASEVSPQAKHRALVILTEGIRPSTLLILGSVFVAEPCNLSFIAKWVLKVLYEPGAQGNWMQTAQSGFALKLKMLKPQGCSWLHPRPGERPLKCMHAWICCAKYLHVKTHPATF